jgi:hypothetical protein
VSPISALRLDGAPTGIETCPNCGAAFEPFLRGQVARDMRSPWRYILGLLGRRRPALALICRRCKEIVGYEW